MSTDLTRIERQARETAIVRLWESLLPLRSVNSFMQTGAHPDDETTRLLARLAKRDGIRVLYACAVRGEGGQNAIGTEAHNAMGVLRTREMEAAARVLGMELCWLNEDYDGAVFDFGFSRTAEETFTHWGRERVLERLVRAIRMTRPDVIAPTFLDVPGQHGHHRAVTVATVEAFALAADPDAFPEHRDQGLPPWRAKKLYLPAWSGAGGTYDDAVPPPNATIEVSVGDFDPVFGATYAQIAQWSRACHRSQGMGRWVPEGEDSVPLHRLECAIEAPEDERSLFDGLPRTVGELAAAAGPGPLADALAEAQAHIDEAFAAFPDNATVAGAVHRALGATRRALASLDGTALDAAVAGDMGYRLALKETQLMRASRMACLLVARLEADGHEPTPGETVPVRLTAFCGGPVKLDRVELDLAVPEGWSVIKRQEENRGSLGRNESASALYDVTVPGDAPVFFPYGFAFNPHGADGPIRGIVRYHADGEQVRLEAGPEETIAVLPPVSLAGRPDAVVCNLAVPGRAFDVEVRATSHRDGATEARVQVSGPRGWRVEPAAAVLSLPGQDAVAHRTFRVTAPEDLRPGRHELSIAVDGPSGSESTVRRIAHSHVAATYMVTPARIPVCAAAVDLPPTIRIGYVDGGSDRVHEWLRRLGLEVDLLGPEDLSDGDLSRYGAIVVGIFAYGRRPDLAAANERLRDYVAGGGNLVTQYHRPWDGWDPGAVPPYYLKIGQPSLRWRICDETADVTHLAPDHELLTYPNRIGPEDWRGWVKERGLYFAAEWAPEYTPLVSMSDPGEQPLEGALLSARYGEGRHTHTALVLHTQMNALVPGAFRLFANLVTPPRRG